MRSLATARRSGKGNKPPKRYPDFPLTPHPIGYWCKCIKREVHYFTRRGKRVNGKMEILPEGGAWKEALDLYLKQKDDLYSGRKPSATPDGKLTIKDLCNRFLTDRTRKIDTGELVQRTFWDYQRVCDCLIKVFEVVSKPFRQ